MLKKIIPITVVTLLAILLILVKTKPDLIESIIHPKKNDALIANSQNITKSKEHKNRFKNHKEKTFPFHSKEEKEMAKKYPEQFRIINKMFYSWDYIHTAQGSYEWGSPDKEIYRGTFYVDLDQKKNLLFEEIEKNGKTVEQTQFLYKDGVAIQYLPAKNIYTKKYLKRKTADKADQVYQEDEWIGLGNSWVTESEHYQFLYHYPDWSYKEGHQYGMPVYQIKGTIAKKISETMEGPFTMTISKETGALLDFRCFGQNDNLIFYLKTKDIKLNQHFEKGEGTFQLNTTGSKELSWQKYRSNLYSFKNYQEKSGED